MLHLLFFLFIDGLTAFRDFLKSEFSDENIEFWMACEDFKKTKTNSQLATKANKIYCEYIKTEAPREVIYRYTLLVLVRYNYTKI